VPRKLPINVWRRNVARAGTSQQLGNAVPIRPETPMALESGPQLRTSCAERFPHFFFRAAWCASPEHCTADLWASRNFPMDFSIEPQSRTICLLGSMPGIG
jgi:hypothetical protein